MKKYLIFLHISLAIWLVSFLSCKTQYNNPHLNKLQLSDTFNNNYIFPNQIGKMYVIDSSAEYNTVLVLWKNDFYSIGKMRDGLVVGSWFLFDKKNCVRRFIGFPQNGGSDVIPTIKIYNKRGKLIKLIPPSISF